MGEAFANGLGTSNLLRHLDNVTASLEGYNTISGPEPSATDLLEQIKDLVAVTSELDNLSVRERRRYSQSASLSAADLVQLHTVCNCTVEVTQECVGFVEPLQSSVQDILRERDSLGYTPDGHRLGDQDWYDDICEALRIRTGVLQILLSATYLLLHKNDKDDAGELSTEAWSLASKLQYQIAFINPKLHNSRERNTAVVRQSPGDVLVVYH
jgi:hypothetical protein